MIYHRIVLDYFYMFVLFSIVELGIEMVQSDLYIIFQDGYYPSNVERLQLLIELVKW